MKENNHNQIEQSLLMYKETVSPSQENLKAILSHIPEQKTKNSLSNLNEIEFDLRPSHESADSTFRQTSKTKKARAIRSPYIWVAVTEFVTLCSIMLALYPTINLEMSNNQIDQEFNIIDEQNDTFQLYMDSTDYDEPIL